MGKVCGVSNHVSIVARSSQYPSLSAVAIHMEILNMPRVSRPSGHTKMSRGIPTPHGDHADNKTDTFLIQPADK